MNAAHALGRIALALVLLPLAACSGGSSTPGGANDLAQSSVTDGSVPGVDMASDYYQPAGYKLIPYLSADAQHSFAAADMVLVGGKDYQAVIETDVGRVVLDLLESDTPITVNSFVFLALHHYFDGIAFHRVIDKFMAQTGDPNTLDENRAAWGSGTPGYKYGLEIQPHLNFDAAGVVGMANAGPATNGSQFFITFLAYPSLNGKYTVFAKVKEGLNVLPLIERGEPPLVPTRMTRVYIVAK